MRALLAATILLALAPAVHAQATDVGQAIRDGRQALESNDPARARDLFARALAQSQRPGNAYAAAIGLGRAELWLGQIPAAEATFRRALGLAASDGERHTARTGLAQALNAEDRPREAWRLLRDDASHDPRSTLEQMRAAQALGWQDRVLPALTATRAPTDTGYLGTRFGLLADDMRYATAPQLEGSTSYSHDSEGLDVWSVGASAFSPLRGEDALVERYGVAVDTVRVSNPGNSRRLQDVSGVGQWRIGDMQSADLRLGLGQTGGWQYLQGAGHWTVQPNDDFALSAGAERAPLLTDAAIARRIAYATYSLGATLRPAGHLYLLPTVFQQRFTDGNRRDGGVARLVLSPYDIGGTPAALGGQLGVRVFRSSQPGGGIYFNPQHYRAVTAGLIGVISLSPQWRLRATADGGRQTTDGSTVGIYTVDVSLEGRLPHNGRLQLHAIRSSAASVSGGGSGYWNNSLAVSVSYPL
ncbi:MAG TPA: tetratricopeptide repeat protein [Dyella sp.]|nr:tetratricopeptide repeat protein [Dyella sp.]